MTESTARVTTTIDPSFGHALLMFSGGFDSTLVALLLRSQRVPTTALTVQYPTRPPGEDETCKRLAPRLGFRDHIYVSLSLSDARARPDAESLEKHEAWFPHRNTIFFGIAAHAAHQHGCDGVASGMRAWDTPYYDDATLSYFNDIGKVLQLTGKADEPGIAWLYLPLIASHDLAIKAIGDPQWQQLLSRTWSCWRYEDEPCGECVPCTSRQKFMSNPESY